MYRIHYSTIKNTNLFCFCIEIRLSIHDLHYLCKPISIECIVCYFLLFPLYTIVLYEYNCVHFRMQLFFILCVWYIHTSHFSVTLLISVLHFSFQCSHFSVLILYSLLYQGMIFHSCQHESTIALGNVTIFVILRLRLRERDYKNKDPM